MACTDMFCTSVFPTFFTVTVYSTISPSFTSPSLFPFIPISNSGPSPVAIPTLAASTFSSTFSPSSSFS